MDINRQTEVRENGTRFGKKWSIHFEVRLQPRASSRFETIRTLVNQFIHNLNQISIPSNLSGWQDVPELATSVEQIAVTDSSCPSTALRPDEIIAQIHVYQPADSSAFEEYATGSGIRDDQEDTMAAYVCELPNRTLEGLWDSLIYGDDIKMKLLDYIYATFVLSDANIDFNLVSWNRVVLLHGPPGTGKTSLCRALAQKLSIRLSHRYTRARLLEINSHSLFSKWFSESGKLVQRLFNSISELADEDDAFLVVLIDEVESLTAARAGAMAGTEPSDGLRVVNALLTQLDKLKHRKNVLIMSTSNLVKAIDTAFVDRADIVQYVDLPSREAIYEILRTCLCEVMKKGVVASTNIPSWEQARMYGAIARSTDDCYPSADSYTRAKSLALKLLVLASRCQTYRLSGRFLRRLPVLALARYIGAANIGPQTEETGGSELELWLEGMEQVLTDQAKELERLV